MSFLPPTFDIVGFQKAVLGWYDLYKRKLPWRYAQYQANIYHVWLSEIMLQQTTVSAVIPYFEKFIEKWPNIQDLAQASLDEIYHAWQGLGYYMRARNLLKCAQIIVKDYAGCFPNNSKDLQNLPGIGPYTAGAISSIGFARPETALDANVERIYARLFAMDIPKTTLKKNLEKQVHMLLPSHRPGDYLQALMDIGSSICTTQSPACELCPVNSFCLGKNTPEIYPNKSVKTKKPMRYGDVYWIENPAGEIVLEKRPSKGLLAGLYGFPTSAWSEDPNSKPHMLLTGERIDMQHTVRHTFTHFHLGLRVFKIYSPKMDGFHWVPKKNIHLYALPTLMKKVVHFIGNS